MGVTNAGNLVTNVASVGRGEGDHARAPCSCRLTLVLIFMSLSGDRCFDHRVRTSDNGVDMSRLGRWTAPILMHATKVYVFGVLLLLVHTAAASTAFVSNSVHQQPHN